MYGMTTISCNLTLVHVSIVLASGYSFLPSYNKGELWNASSQRSMARVRITMPTRKISKVGTLLYPGHFRWHQWCLHYRGSTVVSHLKQCIRTCIFIHNCGPHPPCWVKLNSEGNSLPLGIRDPGCRSSLKNGWAHASMGLMREDGVYSRRWLTRSIASGGVRGLNTQWEEEEERGKERRKWEEEEERGQKERD